MALRTGTALGLSLGGPLPWSMRYGRRLPESPVAALFKELQEILNYEFKSGALLVEAVCHPSFRSPGTSSYQRLEFLGDGTRTRSLVIAITDVGASNRSSH